MKNIQEYNNPEILNLDDYLQTQFSEMEEEANQSAILIGSRLSLPEDTNLLIPYIKSIDDKSQKLASSLDGLVNGETLTLSRNQELKQLNEEQAELKRSSQITELNVKKQQAKRERLKEGLTINAWSYLLPSLGICLTAVAEMFFNGRSLQKLGWSYLESLTTSGGLVIVYIVYGYFALWFSTYLQQFRFISKKLSLAIAMMPLFGMVTCLAFFRVHSQALIGATDQAIFFILLNLVFLGVTSYLVHRAFPRKAQVKLYRDIKALDSDIDKQTTLLKENKNQRLNSTKTFHKGELSKAELIVWLTNAKKQIAAQRDVLINMIQIKIIEMKDDNDLPGWLLSPIPPLDLS